MDPWARRAGARRTSRPSPPQIPVAGLLRVSDSGSSPRRGSPNLERGPISPASARHADDRATNRSSCRHLAGPSDPRRRPPPVDLGRATYSRSPPSTLLVETRRLPGSGEAEYENTRRWLRIVSPNFTVLRNSDQAALPEDAYVIP